MIDFHHRIVPTRGLESLVLKKEQLETLKEVIAFEKARQILFSQWGFDKVIGEDRGTSVMFWGPPGTGKSLAAEAIAFSTGKPLRIINTGELLSKWVGDTPKNINSVFEEAKSYDAVLVFDEAEGLFGTRTSNSTSTDRYANVDVGLLLYHMEHFNGVIILCTNMVKDLDPAFFRRLKFVVEFGVPDATERLKLWKMLIPTQCPVSTDVDLQRLANQFEFTGGVIKNVIVRAASRAALRVDKKDYWITMNDIEISASEELNKGEKSGNSNSNTRQMYN